MADRKIYFATDIHGSEVCLRKFLNAAKFYDCDTMIMGGDITGKMIVPIVERGQGVHTPPFTGATCRSAGTAWPSCARRSPTPAITPTRRRPRRWTASTAVRDALAKYQPMLSLHGHIHESRGEARIGRTLAINPGSEYSEGVLRGAIITLSRKKGVRGYQLVAG